MSEILYTNTNTNTNTKTIQADHFIIYKDNNSYKIEFKTNSFLLIQSIIKTKLIRGASADENYRIIKFNATSVLSFKEYQQTLQKINGTKKFSIYDVSNMIISLSKQTNYLIKETNHTFLGYDIENMLVINGNIILYLNDQLIVPVNEDKMALISFPFDKKNIFLFLSPELLNVSEIPSFVHYKTIYFSLACLTIYALTHDNEFYLEYLRNNGEINFITECLNKLHLKHTKLYWLLERCLIKESDNRSILFI